MSVQARGQVLLITIGGVSYRHISGSDDNVLLIEVDQLGLLVDTLRAATRSVEASPDISSFRAISGSLPCTCRPM